MIREQATLDDARTTEQPAGDAPDVLVTDYSVTIKANFTAYVTLTMDGPAGEVTVRAALDARDTRRRITRNVTITAPRLTTTLTESDLADWTTQTSDVHRSDRALKAAIDVQYVQQSDTWYRRSQRLAASASDVGAPGVADGNGGEAE